MKRLFYITSIIVLSCVIASGFIIPITTDVNSGNSADLSAGDNDSEYIIKSLGDRIVVYRGNSQNPCLETTTAVSSLPKAVQRQINEGIHYDSEDEMKKALDEFCS